MATLIDSVCDIVKAIRGYSAPSDRGRITDAFAGNGLSDNPPKWMEEFVGAIAKGKISEELFTIPTGYPGGENGLINSLLDVDEQVFPLGILDSGECVEWRIPRLHVFVFWSRESGPTYDAAIRPDNADLNAWLQVKWTRN